MAQNGNGDEKGLTISAKAFGAAVAAVAVAFGGGYATRGGEAQAAGVPCPSSSDSEMGKVRERLVAVEVTVVEMNKKLDSLVAVKDGKR